MTKCKLLYTIPIVCDIIIYYNIHKVYNAVVIRMLTDNKLLRIKNGVLLLLAVICPIVCRLISIPLPSVMTEWDKTSLYIRNMTGYLRDNYVSLVFFFVFVTSGLTSLLLGNLIHRRFDRNKEASVISLRAGLFFLIAAAFFLTDANTLTVRVLGFLFCFFVMSSALLHIRTLSGK